MKIVLEHEDKETMKMFGGVVEVCHFCSTPTRWWCTYSNNPVCPSCAEKHDTSELPDYGKLIRKAKGMK